MPTVSVVLKDIDTDGKVITKHYKNAKAYVNESAKSRGEPLSDMLRCATLRACPPLPHQSASTRPALFFEASVHSSGAGCVSGVI